MVSNNLNLIIEENRHKIEKELPSTGATHAVNWKCRTPISSATLSILKKSSLTWSKQQFSRLTSRALVSTTATLTTSSSPFLPALIGSTTVFSDSMNQQSQHFYHHPLTNNNRPSLNFPLSSSLYEQSASGDQLNKASNFLSLSLSPPRIRRREMPALRGPYVSLSEPRQSITMAENEGTYPDTPESNINEYDEEQEDVDQYCRGG